ncbi:MAG: D-alanyl-D-alanine carboxypeptidase family protein [Burkholderiales bacterium]
MKSILLILCVSLAWPAYAQSDLSLPKPPVISAWAYWLGDFQTGQVLARANENRRAEPASLTKLMTAYVVFKTLNDGQLTLTQNLPVSAKAWQAEGSRMFINPSTPVTVEELLHGMIVQSGNDACIALAEGVGGSEENFVRLMNNEARRLGMKNTHFTNSSGLPDPGHYSTAFDISIMAKALIRDFPEMYPYYSIKEYTYNSITQANRNRLLWQDAYVDGLKTGHSQSSGFSLVSSAKRGTMRLIAVVLGAGSDQARAEESQKLLNFGFQQYTTGRLYRAGQTVAQLTVWRGSNDSVAGGFERDLYVTLPREKQRHVKATLISRQPLLAPLYKGQKVGTLRLSLANQTIADYPVVTLESIGVANIFKRGWDNLKLFFNRLRG